MKIQNVFYLNLLQNALKDWLISQINKSASSIIIKS